MTSSTRVWSLVGLFWLGGVVAGIAWLAAYSNRPGMAAAPPTQWPVESAIPRADGRPTLVMLAHPRCTCSRASLEELAELLARARNRPQTYVIFIRPDTAEEEWEKTDLWQRATAIAGVTVVRDDRGTEAARFGARTSGQTLLYDADGSLRWTGGITGARGHPGENAGRAALLALLDSKSLVEAETPVYGCSLFDPDDEPEEESPHVQHAS